MPRVVPGGDSIDTRTMQQPFLSDKPIATGAPHDASYRILLIDDREDVLEPLATALRARGHNVRSTTHGSDLLRLADLTNPDVLVTDVIMEDVDTLEALSALRRARPELKIIAISGNPHLLTLASKHGANHVLAKPFEVEKLNVLIKVAMQ